MPVSLSDFFVSIDFEVLQIKFESYSSGASYFLELRVCLLVFIDVIDVQGEPDFLSFFLFFVDGLHFSKEFCDESLFFLR